MYSVLNYIGKKEVNLLEDMMVLDMKVYCEPFSGSYNTGFKLIDTGYKAKYILNDLDENIYNFWLQLKNKHSLVETRIKYMIDKIDKLIKGENTKEDNKRVEEYLNKKLESSWKVDRAAAEFIYRQSITMDGLKYRRSKIENILSLDFYINHEYLMGVTLSNKDYKEMFKKYDSKNTFFFIDPPYSIDRVDKYYRCDCSKFDHKELSKKIKKLQGRWLLTYNYDEKILDMYKDYNIEVVERKMFGRTYRELYIRNYKI